MNALLVLLEHVKTFRKKKTEKNHHDLYKSLNYVHRLLTTKVKLESNRKLLRHISLLPFNLE